MPLTKPNANTPDTINNVKYKTVFVESPVSGVLPAGMSPPGTSPPEVFPPGVFPVVSDSTLPFTFI